MADRRRLRDRAKSAGKSVAGTLSEGAQKLKKKAKTIARDDESGVEISEVGGQYLVIDSDGSANGPYDDKMKAAAKARELKREKQQTQSTGMNGEQQSQGRVQQAATRFSEGVNRRLNVGQDGDSEGEGKTAKERFDAFATSFAQGVNETAEGERESADDAESAPTMPLMGGTQDGESGGPTLAFMGDPDNDGDMELAFFGDVDGDGQQDMMLFEPNQGQEPAYPGFGMGGGGAEMPSMFGGGEDNGGPQIPAFQMERDEDDSEPRYPWR